MSLWRAALACRWGRVFARGTAPLQPRLTATISTSATHLTETEDGESVQGSKETPPSQHFDDSHHFDDSQHSDDSQHFDDSQQRSTVLQASLQFVPEFGWSPAALAEGARSLGLAKVTPGMFPRGGGDLVDHFEAECNATLVKFMQQQELKGSKLLRSSIEHRLRMLIPYLSKWPQAMALKAFPANTPSALQTLALMVDDMWYWAGDRSTDFSWYTKRALLTSIYVSTELHMVQDSSVDFQDTWDFLGNRMEDSAALGQARKQLEASIGTVTEFVSAGFTTARNMVGLNCRNR